MLNIHKKMVVDFYVDEYSAGVWGHNNYQNTIFANIRTVFVVTFSKFYLMCVSKIQREISLSTIHSECVALHHYVRY